LAGTSTEDVETKNENNNPSSPTATEPDRFLEFWYVYPRKVGKEAARKAWAKALKLSDPDAIIRGAMAYRDDPTRKPDYTAHPTTWLNAGRWQDEAAPASTRWVGAQPDGSIQPNEAHYGAGGAFWQG
jgi:hypothetical protein